MRYNAPVAPTPNNVQANRNCLRRPPRSAIAPRMGARIAMMSPATELATPRRDVVAVAETSVLQNFWKNTGKKPAMTVVANAELAQSYSAQAKTCLFLKYSSTPRGYQETHALRFSRLLAPQAR